MFTPVFSWFKLKLLKPPNSSASSADNSPPSSMMFNLKLNQKVSLKMQYICVNHLFIVSLLYSYICSCQQLDSQERRCVFDVKCSRYHLECSKNENPNPLGEHEGKMLRDMCPSLVPSKINNFERVPLCCSSFTVGRLKVFFGFIREHFPHSGCWMNFRQLFCHLFCSSRQADFIRIDSIDGPTKDDRELYVHIDYYLSERFSRNIHECCRDMKQLSDPHYDIPLLIPIMCSRIQDGDSCDKERWFRSIMYYRLPTIFDFRVIINFIHNLSKPVLKEGQIYVPLDEPTYPCNSSLHDDNIHQNCDSNKPPIGKSDSPSRRDGCGNRTRIKVLACILILLTILLVILIVFKVWSLPWSNRIAYAVKTIHWSRRTVDDRSSISKLEVTFDTVSITWIAYGKPLQLP